MRKLRWQLIGLLLGVALLPALPAALTVHALFQRSLGAGAEERVLAGARAGLEGVREKLDAEKARFRDRVRAEGGVVLDEGPERTIESGSEVLAARVRTARGDSVRVFAPLPPALVERARDITESVQLLETLRRDRGPVLRGLLATFLAVYGGILALVVLLGLLVTSRLTRPLQALGEGIDRVAGGDLGTRVAVGGSGHLRGLLGRFNQMVERLDRQREELVRLEKLAAWRNLARRLAHEIKNPLTPIQLAAQQMRDAYPGEDPEYRLTLDEGAGIVEEEVRSLRALVREFSEFARLPQPQPRVTAVRDLLADIVALYGAEKVVATPAPEEGLTAWCDPDEVHRVLINLVDNALHAQQEVGRSEPVVVGARRGPAGFVVVEVRDRGPGVRPEDRRRVFAPDVSMRTEGMGLGLAIVEEIVRAHGGTIEIGEREGGGAVLRFTLPGPAAGAERGST